MKKKPIHKMSPCSAKIEQGDVMLLLFKYFFDYMLSMADSGYKYQKTADEVKRAKKIINQVKEYEYNGYLASAENEIKKLLPEV